MKCIFCQIVNKKIPKKILYEDDKVIVIKNIKPVAAVHLLIISKKHIPSIKGLKPKDKDLISHMIFVAQKIARQRKFKGYKLAFNVGKEGGQMIPHLHLHLLSGKIKALP